MTANDVNAGDATLAVLDASHALHGEFAKAFNITDKSDWYKLDKTAAHLNWFLAKGCRIRCIQCPAGSMVFWDSRTIHCGIEASNARATPNTRCVAYVCMTPKKWCSAAGIKKRIKAFEDRRTTSHWPHKPKLFPRLPQTYGKAVQRTAEPIRPVLSAIGRALVGDSPQSASSSSTAAAAAAAAESKSTSAAPAASTSSPPALRAASN